VGGNVGVAVGAGAIGDPEDVGIAATVILVTGAAGADFVEVLQWMVGTRGDVGMADLALRIGPVARRRSRQEGVVGDRLEGLVAGLAVAFPTGVDRRDRSG